MNPLSQLLYFADVVDTLKVVLGIFGVFGGSVGAIAVSCTFDAKAYDDAADIANRKMVRRLGVNLISVSLLCILLGVFVPTKSTMYAIAASEMGENALQSETGSLATQALNAWLKKQVTPTAPAAPE